jgi:hypothetical protein
MGIYRKDWNFVAGAMFMRVVSVPCFAHWLFKRHSHAVTFRVATPLMLGFVWRRLQQSCIKTRIVSAHSRRLV